MRKKVTVGSANVQLWNMLHGDAYSQDGSVLVGRNRRLWCLIYNDLTILWTIDIGNGFIIAICGSVSGGFTAIIAVFTSAVIPMHYKLTGRAQAFGYCCTRGIRSSEE